MICLRLGYNSLKKQLFLVELQRPIQEQKYE